MSVSKNLIEQIFTLIGKDNLKINEPMRLHTTFQVGGPADLYLTPKGIRQLCALLLWLKKSQIPAFVIGRGSNLVVSDKGIRGAVINTDKLNRIRLKDDLIQAECGVNLSSLSKWSAKHRFTGLEFACGIPGSVGGAVYMNAGAYDGEISQVLESSRVLVFDVEKETYRIINLNWDEHAFFYRHSIFQDKPLIHLSSSFRLKTEQPEKIWAAIESYTRAREEKQPLEFPSAGSVFRRPQGYYTAKLIEECGLKGFRIGGAAVSEKHCGFIINLGNATAQDIRKVIEHIQETVYAKFGVTLQTEVKFIGE
ncbi:MAG: UDP-N-acetylmuramate dehydrogenase [Candidatus Cloacimonadaceae bacterium]